jgi:hypothetical protein
MKKGILAALALGFLGGQAFADTQTVTFTNIFPTIFDPGVLPSINGQALNYTTNSTSIALPKWNPDDFPNRILTGITVTMTAYMYGTYSINELTEEATVTFSWNSPLARVFNPFEAGGTLLGQRGTSAAQFSELTTVLENNPPVTLGSPQTGTTVLVTSTTTAPLTPTGALSLYSGPGFILFPVSQSGAISVAAESTSTAESITVSSTTAKFGAMTLAITYTHVPETGTAAAATAISLAAGSIVWRRRQQKRTLGS